MTGIINYGAGNIFSLKAALDRLDIPYGMVDQVDELDRYDRIIIPGGGHAGAAMRKLEASGLAKYVGQLTKPVLGICVGMQLLTQYSEEGDSSLLDVVPLKTLHFENRLSGKVPHMGWNRVFPENDCPLFDNVGKYAYFFFVYAYFFEYNATFTAAYTQLVLTFSTALHARNFICVQFLSEHSGVEFVQILLQY